MLGGSCGFRQEHWCRPSWNHHGESHFRPHTRCPTQQPPAENAGAPCARWSTPHETVLCVHISALGITRKRKVHACSVAHSTTVPSSHSAWRSGHRLPFSQAVPGQDRLLLEPDEEAQQSRELHSARSIRMNPHAATKGVRTVSETLRLRRSRERNEQGGQGFFGNADWHMSHRKPS